MYILYNQKSKTQKYLLHNVQYATNVFVHQLIGCIKITQGLS